MTTSPCRRPRVRAAGFTCFVGLTPLFVGAQTTSTPPAAEKSAAGQTAAAKVAPQTADQKRDAELEELRRRIDLLATEIEALRRREEQAPPLTPEQRRRLGLGPSAAPGHG